ncbi:hypothetical protein Q4K74_003451 [Vibrio cholerae]|nr:hypothetical protein [Vibrio cholerae]ELL0578723.1 hypothetical protein [Vibrio cholerae]ELT7226851.1 hypothetical protein [Vibrio cholerae]
MKTTLATIFLGTFLFYLTFTPIWLLSNNSVDSVEEFNLKIGLDFLPQNFLPLNFDAGTGMELLGYNIESDFSDLLDEHNATEVKFEKINPRDALKKYGEDTYSLIKLAMHNNADTVEANFVLNTDVHITLLFISNQKTLFPPRFSEFSAPIAAQVETGGDLYRGDIQLAAHLVRELSHENKEVFISNLIDYLE